MTIVPKFDSYAMPPRRRRVRRASTISRMFWSLFWSFVGALAAAGVYVWLVQQFPERFRSPEQLIEQIQQEQQNVPHSH